MTALTFASWFSGIGGFELGLQAAGHRCVYACEIDPFPRAVYEARFGHAPEGGDINRVRADEIPHADLWCGGFPCQDLSVAGRREGIDGERSGLVWRLLDLAAEVRPRWLLLENVPGLLSVDGGRGFGRLLARLDDLGFDAAWRVLDARFYGVPQRRRRVFIAAGRAGDGCDPAKILLEPEGVRRRPPPSRAARARTAGSTPGGAGSGGSPGFDFGGGDGGQGQGEVAHAVSASAGHHGRSSPRGDGGDDQVVAPVAAKWAKGTGGPAGDEVQNLVAPEFVAGFRHTAGGHSPDFTPDAAPTLKAAQGGGGATEDGPASACTVDATVQAHHARNAADDQLVVAATRQCGGHPNSNMPGRRAEDDLNLVAYQCHGGNVGPLGHLRAGNGNETGGVPFIINAAESWATKDHGRETDTSRALDTTGGFSPGQGGTVIAFDPTQITSAENRSHCDADGPSPPETAKARAPHVAFGFNSRAESGTGGNGYTLDGAPPVRGTNPPPVGSSRSFVRRLTPRECERLQGLPDDWTLIPGASDSRRYKAVGNGVAVPVIAWIGRRFAEHA